MARTKAKTAIIPLGDGRFPSVRKAREALKEKAFELQELYILIIRQAAAAGDFETAAKSLQWLLDHTPDEEGQRLIEPSVDKPSHTEQRTGPSISIGHITLGGLPKAPEPIPVTIDVK